MYQFPVWVIIWLAVSGEENGLLDTEFEEAEKYCVLGVGEARSSSKSLSRQKL